MAATFTEIAKVTVGSSGASSIDFNSIPGNYTDLLLKISARTSRSDYSDWVKVRFNGSSTSYSFKNLEGLGSGSPASYSGGNDLTLYTGGNAATSNIFGNGEIYISNYAGSAYKSVSSDGVSENNATSAIASINAYLWSNTAAITSISMIPNVGPNFLEYSTAYLYGIKKS